MTYERCTYYIGPVIKRGGLCSMINLCIGPTNCILYTPIKWNDNDKWQDWE